MNCVKNGVAWLLLGVCGIAPGGAQTTQLSPPKVSSNNAAQSEKSGVRGAQWVLARINRPADWGQESEIQNAQIVAFQRDVEAFCQQSRALSPASAARRWLDLALRFQTLARRKESKSVGDYSYGFSKLLGVLPPPSSWNELSRLIAQRHQTLAKPQIYDHVLLLLARVLTGSETERWNALDALRRAAVAQKTSNIESSNNAVDVGRIGDALMAVSSQRGALERGFKLHLLPGGQNDWEEVSLPLALDKMNDADATRFIENALLSSRFPLSVSGSSERIRRLAQRLALKNVRKLPVAQWGLAHSVEALPLYLALENRPFSANASDEDSPYGGQPRELAQQFALLALLQKGRVAQAQSLIVSSRPAKAPKQFELMSNNSWVGEDWSPSQSANEELRSWLEQPSHRAVAVQLFDLLKPQLQNRPDTAGWDLFETTAALTARRSVLIAVYRALLARTDLSKQSRRGVQDRLARALLGSGRTEEGVASLRLVTAQKDDYNRSESVMRLAKIAVATGRRDWMDEAVAGFRRNAEYNDYQRDDFLRLLMQARRWSDVEAFALETLQKAAQPLPTTFSSTTLSSNESDDDASGDMERERKLEETRAQFRAIRAARAAATSNLIALADLYSRLGRHDDVLALLEQSPLWSANDLSPLLMRTGAGDVPLGVLAARALVARHRGDDYQRASRIARAVLQQNADIDAPYEILLTTDGADVLPLLDQMAQDDRFEERPLIWKAELLRRTGNLVEAEGVARAAIAIDPSDGEQGAGDRLRAYRVLDDILTARGQLKEAALFRNAVAAIRLSEKADALHAAGLNDAAIALYKRSLTFFADAYCIQARLALQLAAQGRMSEASAHYRRAYELMPSSFGRTESHCFGCEGAFSGAPAQSIAERVFSQMLAKSPRSPQLHYLLGYLRQEQGDSDGARVSYLQAVKLDADYINAWKKLREVSLALQRPAREIDAATLQILRLQPRQKQNTYEYYNTTISDLGALWNTVAKTPTTPKTENPTPLLALAASVESKIEYSMTCSESNPSATLATTGVLQALSDFVRNDNDSFWSRRREAEQRARQQKKASAPIASPAIASPTV